MVLFIANNIPPLARNHEFWLRKGVFDENPRRCRVVSGARGEAATFYSAGAAGESLRGFASASALAAPCESSSEERCARENAQRPPRPSAERRHSRLTRSAAGSGTHHAFVN